MKLYWVAALSISSLLLAGCLGNNTVTDNTAQQFTTDTTAISQYLSLVAPDAIKTPAGVWYEIISEGTGYYPTYSDTITVNYVGKILSTGTVFDDKSTTAFTVYSLSTLIAGWQVGLPKLREGTTARLYIPSGLAYGTGGANGVPANSNLQFDITVKKVSGYQTKKDIATIDNYISANSIANVIKDNSGVRYVVTTTGSGLPPYPSDKVTVTYSGALLSSPSSLFVSVTDKTELYLPGLLNAWGIVLTKVSPGSTVTMYVPSGLGYGVRTNVTGVPANSNLIFTINLISSRH
jgi:FKBP-type peptidyl-prolyl cis-trans isomerase FkpA